MVKVVHAYYNILNTREVDYISKWDPTMHPELYLTFSIQW